MKKILSVLSILCGISQYFIPLLWNNVYADEERYFIVTAYYSPLPNQNNYLKGDYEKEKILNGEGIRGASGKKVFSGMLAAPKTYSFGTKIYLEGVGIGSVEDRGGAIVNAGQRGHKYDRIDIWVGYGDEGLKRALAWGKRTVKGKILSNPQEVSIDIDTFKIPKNLVLKNTSSYSYNGPSVLYKSIGKDSSVGDIKELQDILKKNGLYNGETDGKYNVELIDTIYSFQKTYKIVESNDDPGAGYWGVKTRKKFLSLYNSNFFSSVKTSTDPVQKDIFTTYLTPTSQGESVKELQNILKELGLYDGENTGKYTDIVDIILNYQLEKEIIHKKNEVAAGHFGPKTRASLQKDYTTLLVFKKEQELYNKKIEQYTKEAQKSAHAVVQSIGNVKYGDVSSQVRELQITLKDLGYFNYQDTATFGKITKQSIIAYQIDNEIIKDENETVAGLIGPKTKQSLEEDITDMLLEEMLKDITPPENTNTEVALK